MQLMCPKCQQSFELLPSEVRRIQRGELALESILCETCMSRASISSPGGWADGIHHALPGPFVRDNPRGLRGSAVSDGNKNKIYKVRFRDTHAVRDFLRAYALIAVVLYDPDVHTDLHEHIQARY